MQLEETTRGRRLLRTQRYEQGREVDKEREGAVLGDEVARDKPREPISLRKTGGP